MDFPNPSLARDLQRRCGSIKVANTGARQLAQAAAGQRPGGDQFAQAAGTGVDELLRLRIAEDDLPRLAHTLERLDPRAMLDRRLSAAIEGEVQCSLEHSQHPVRTILGPTLVLFILAVTHHAVEPAAYLVRRQTPTPARLPGLV